MSTRDLINAIESGDSVAIEQSFQQEMASRIADRLDTMRVEVAKNMFNEAACKTKMKSEEEMDDEEEMKEELNLEDYSVEEVEEYMQTEDFEQLDELSKNTLASYVKKASDEVMSKSGEAGYKLSSNEGDAGNSDYRKAYYRNKGVKKAVDKLAK